MQVTIDQFSANFAQLQLTPMPPAQAQPVPQVDEKGWVKSFDVIYGTKNPDLNSHKVVTIEGDNIHYALRCRENEERSSRDYKDGVPNYVVASMSFVVSDRPRVKGGHHGRRVITVPVKFKAQNITHVTDVYKFDQKITEPRKYSRSSEFLNDLIEDSPADRKTRIEGYYNKGTNSFSDSYHHSERAMWGALKTPEVIQALVEGILSQMPPQARNDNPLANRIKIYSAVLDAHSTRYMCFECEPASHGFQRKQGKFMVRLQAALSTYFTLSPKNGVTLFTRVSAEDESRQSPQELESHHNYWRTRNIKEIRGKNISLVLLRDDRKTQKDVKPYSVFVSSEKINPPLPVFLTHRKDNPLSTIKLTDANQQFNAHSIAIVQQVQSCIDKIAKSTNFAEKLQLVKEAYALQPNNINVLINYYNVLYQNNYQIESLEFLRKAQAYYIQQNEQGHANYKIFRHVLVGIFKNAFFCACGDNHKYFIEKASALECLEQLSERDFPLFYFLRGMYFTLTERQDQARDDYEIAYKRLSQDDFANPQDFAEIMGYLKTLIEYRPTN